MNRQHNGHNRDTWTNSDLHNTAQKTRDWTTRTPQNKME